VLLGKKEPGWTAVGIAQIMGSAIPIYVHRHNSGVTRQQADDTAEGIGRQQVRLEPTGQRAKPIATPQVPCPWPPRGLRHARFLRLPASRALGAYYRPIWGLTCASLLLPAPLHATHVAIAGAWPEPRQATCRKARGAVNEDTLNRSRARLEFPAVHTLLRPAGHSPLTGIKVSPSRAFPGSDENTVRLARVAPLLHRRRR
jgi:hypothetical protein